MNAFPSAIAIGIIHSGTMNGKLNGVVAVSAISNLPGGQFNQNSIFTGNDPESRIDASELFVDIGFTDVLNMEIVDGRKFDRSYAADSAGTNFIVNEITVKQLGLTEPIGSKLVWLDDDATIEGTIVGVVRDFHYKSLHYAIQPLLIMLHPQDLNHFVLKISSVGIKKTLVDIEQIYNLFDGKLGFDSFFLDQQMADLYENEVRTLSVFSVFAGVALFLACLGLLGIALAILNQKIKEVGIRKILGASPRQIAQMIVAQFAQLIGIALVIGLPIAYLLMQEWIEEFPYQVNLGLSPFVISSLVLVIVALVSVSAVIIKIASTNPVNSLRYE